LYVAASHEHTKAAAAAAALQAYDSTNARNCRLVTASIARSTVVDARKSWIV
jgi:hypothetical protein